MAAPRTADAHGQVTLALALEARQQVAQEIRESHDGLFDLALRPKVVDDFRVAARERAQLRDEVRVRQEANVEEHIEAARQPVPEAERRDDHVQIVCAALFTEAVLDHVAQSVHGQLRRVDDHVGEVSDFREQLALLMYRRQHVPVGQGVRPSRLAVPAQEDFVISFQEQHRQVYALALQLAVNSREEPEKLPRPDVDYEGRAVYLARVGAELHERGDELDGEVIYGEMAEVFKGLEGR